MKTKFPEYTSEEVILILNLYLKNRDSSILQQKDKRIIQISNILKEIRLKNYPKWKIPESFRSPSAIVYKFKEFKSYDENPEKIKSKLGREIWSKYKSKQLSIIDEEANAIIEKYFPGIEQFHLLS